MHPACIYTNARLCRRGNHMCTAAARSLCCIEHRRCGLSSRLNKRIHWVVLDWWIGSVDLVLLDVLCLCP
jgi:hypothetical protein